MTPADPTDSVNLLADVVSFGYRTGVPLTADDLRTRFPDLAADLTALAGLVRVLEMTAAAARQGERGA